MASSPSIDMLAYTEGNNSCTQLLLMPCIECLYSIASQSYIPDLDVSDLHVFISRYFCHSCHRASQRQFIL